MGTKNTTFSNLFENAVRKKFRFPSSKGPVTLEDLWDVPLRADNGFSLNDIAKAVNAKLAKASEEDFVGDAKLTIEQTTTKNMLDVVKYVIDVKIDEAAKSKDRAARKIERAKIMDALMKKQDAAYANQTESALKKRLEALDDEDDE